jgi:uncharacterized membrane protein YdjX (TVP38/TMEM64 family)
MTKEKIAGTIDYLRGFVNGLGVLGPIFFITTAALAIAAYIPSVVIIYFGVSIWGGVIGTVISAISIYTATILIYFTAQGLGREFVVRISAKKLKRLEARLENRGFWTVFYLRLIFFMAPPLNWLLALTNINLRNFFWGTVLGTAHQIIIVAWLTDMVVDLIKTGRSLNPFQTPKLFIPLGIGITILVTTRLIDWLRLAKGNWSTDKHIT